MKVSRRLAFFVINTDNLLDCLRYIEAKPHSRTPYRGLRVGAFA